jgi:hypothetical protein
MTTAFRITTFQITTFQTNPPSKLPLPPSICNQCSIMRFLSNRQRQPVVLFLRYQNPSQTATCRCPNNNKNNITHDGVDKAFFFEFEQVWDSATHFYFLRLIYGGDEKDGECVWDVMKYFII